MRKRLTFRMQQVLLLLHRGQPANALCHGMAEHGGHRSVMAGLERRGLVVTADGTLDSEWMLTAEGQRVASELVASS